MTTPTFGEAPHGPEQRPDVLHAVEQLAATFTWNPAIPGYLVGGYLVRATLPEASMQEVRGAAHMAALWRNHFAQSRSADVARLPEKQATSQIIAHGAAWMMFNIAQFPSVEHTSVDYPHTLPHELSPEDALAASVKKYCNTSAPGSIVDAARLGEHYGVSLRQVRSALQTSGAVLSSDPYYARKVGEVGYEAEIDPILSPAQGRSALMFFGRVLEELGVTEDIKEISQALQSSPDVLSPLNTRDLATLRGEAFTNLEVLMGNPLAVARAVEVLPGNDPRFMLLQLLIERNGPEDIVSMLGRYNQALAIQPSVRLVQANIGGSLARNYAVAEGGHAPQRDERAIGALMRRIALDDPDAPEGVRRPAPTPLHMPPRPPESSE